MSEWSILTNHTGTVVGAFSLNQITDIYEASKITKDSTQFSVLRARRSRPFCSRSPTPPLRNSSTSCREYCSSSWLTTGSSAARYRSHVCFKEGTGSFGRPSWCTRDLSALIWVVGLISRHGFTMPGRSCRKWSSCVYIQLCLWLANEHNNTRETILLLLI